MRLASSLPLLYPTPDGELGLVTASASLQLGSSSLLVADLLWAEGHWRRGHVRETCRGSGMWMVPRSSKTPEHLCSCGRGFILS